MKLHFNVSEIKDLCLDIGVEYEDVAGGEVRAAWSRELVRYCYRYNRTEELITICKKLRPNALWTTLDDQSASDGYLPDNQPLVQTPRIGKTPKQLSEGDIEKLLSEYTEWRLVEIEEPSVPGGNR